jgi:uncharacterized membrane protein (UPF0127 family)
LARLWLADRLVVPHLRIADTFWTRLKGLGFISSFPEGHGLLISPCNSIHTLWPKLRLDVLFLTADLRVVRILPNLGPYRLSPIVPKARHVLELPVGTVSLLDLQVGQQFRMEP